MIAPRWLLASTLLLCTSCVIVSKAEPWAPLSLTLDDQVVGPHNEAFVYVDGDYCGNFVDGKFKLYLTLEPHEVKVCTTGFQDWVAPVAMDRNAYPDGTSMLVTPVRAQ
jgi:hypothetical protein